MEEAGPGDSRRASDERIARGVGKFHRFRTGCGCVTIVMAVVIGGLFLLLTWGVVSRSMRAVRVDGRVESLQTVEEKNRYGFIRTVQKAVVRYRFQETDYTVPMTTGNERTRIGGIVPVFLDPKDPEQVSFRKESPAEMVKGFLALLVLISLPVLASYGIYWWMGKIQVAAYLGDVPALEKAFARRETGAAGTEGGSAAARAPAEDCPPAGLKTGLTSWLIEGSPTLIVMALLFVCILKGWQISSTGPFIAVIAVILAQKFITSRLAKRYVTAARAASSTAGRPPGAVAPESPSHPAWSVQSENPRSWLIGAGAVFILAAGVIAFYSIQGKLRGDRLSAAERVTGRVVDVAIVRHESSLSSDFYPVIAYTFGGREYRYRSKSKFSQDSFSLGDSVELLVNPDDPEEAAIDNAGKRDVYRNINWGLFLVLAFLGWAILRKGLTMKPGEVD